MIVSIETLIPHDKALHALGGAAIFALARVALLWVGLPPNTVWICALATVGVLAVAKELYDLNHRATHTPEVRDALFTIGGGLLGAACSLAVA